MGDYSWVNFEQFYRMRRKKKNKKKDYNGNFLFFIGFVLLGALAFTLDPDGFGDNVFQVGKGFIYVVLLIMFGLIMVALDKNRNE